MIVLDGTNGETFPSWTTSTRPSSPNAGQMGYNTTNSVMEMYNGTNWVNSSANLGGSFINYGTAVTASGQTAITFTGIPSTAKRITVMLNGVKTSGTSPIQAQLVTSGGTISTGYTSSAAFAGSAEAGYTSSTGLLIIGGTSSAVINDGASVIYNISGNNWVNNSTVGRADSYVFLAGGSVSLSSTLTGIVITMVNGTDTFTAGSVNIFWE
jgi:hypothetical protein